MLLLQRGVGNQLRRSQLRIKLTFKSPKTVNAAIDDVLGHLDCDNPEFIEKNEAIRKSLQKWVRYGEYVAIEVDTDMGTAIVLPAR